MHILTLKISIEGPKKELKQPEPQQKQFWTHEAVPEPDLQHRVLEMKRSGVGQTHPQFFDMLLSIKNEVENLRSVLLSHRGFAE